MLDVKHLGSQISYALVHDDVGCLDGKSQPTSEICVSKTTSCVPSSAYGTFLTMQSIGTWAVATTLLVSHCNLHAAPPSSASNDDRRMKCQVSIKSRVYFLQGDSISDAAAAPDDAALLSRGPADSNDLPAPVMSSPTPSVASPQASSNSDDSLGVGGIVGIVLAAIVVIPVIATGVRKMYTFIRRGRTVGQYP